VRAWTAFVEQGDEVERLVRPEILQSWERSDAARTRDVVEAPLADEQETRAFWADSPLRAAAFQTMPSAAADANADASLTVFIDGPSGFTYVWNRDGGWKFIGKLVDDAL